MVLVDLKTPKGHFEINWLLKEKRDLNREIGILIETIPLNTATILDLITNPLLGNGFCNMETNIAECQYDFGECCPSSILNGIVEKAENCDDINCECNPDSSVNFPGDCLVGTDGTCQKGM